VATLENEDSDSVSEKIVAELIDRYPGLRGLYIVGGGVQGVCRVLEEKGLRGRIKVISYDLVQSRDYCKRGVIDFVIDQDPVQEGYRALKVLNDYVIFNEVPEEKVYTRIDIRTRENLE
jgi:LacI family transcriptional regulator